MDILLDTTFTEMSEEEILECDGGNFFGIVSGVAQVIHGASMIAIGATAMKVPGMQWKAAGVITHGFAQVASGISNTHANIRR